MPPIVSDFAALQRRKCSANSDHSLQCSNYSMTSVARSIIDGGTVRPSALNRQFRRLRAAQNAIDISGGMTKGVYLVDSVGEQSAVSDKVRIRIDRRYVVSGRRRYYRRAMRDREYIRHDDKAASRLAPKGDDGRFDVYVACERAQ